MPPKTHKCAQKTTFAGVPRKTLDLCQNPDPLKAGIVVSRTENHDFDDPTEMLNVTPRAHF